MGSGRASMVLTLALLRWRKMPVFRARPRVGAGRWSAVTTVLPIGSTLPIGSALPIGSTGGSAGSHRGSECTAHDHRQMPGVRGGDMVPVHVDDIPADHRRADTGAEPRRGVDIAPAGGHRGETREVVVLGCNGAGA